MNTINAVGMKIRQLRQNEHLTQEELAEKAGLHHTYIGQVERGEKNLTVQTLSRVLEALNISFEDFFKGFDGCCDSNSTYAQCMELIGNLSESKREKLLSILSDIIAF